jgi:hypothetical protein
MGLKFGLPKPQVTLCAEQIIAVSKWENVASRVGLRKRKLYWYKSTLICSLTKTPKTIFYYRYEHVLHVSRARLFSYHPLPTVLNNSCILDQYF